MPTNTNEIPERKNREQSHHAPLCYSAKKNWGVYLRCNINYPTFPSGIHETAVSPASSSPRVEPIRPKCICLPLSLKS